MNRLLLGLMPILAATLGSGAYAQATARPCDATEQPGPACLLARTELASLPAGELFWQLDRFASKDAAQRAAIATSTIVSAFGSTWLFTLAQADWRPKGGEHAGSVGPLPVQPAPSFEAEYLRSVFLPGTKAPLHVHSGPEAFYAVSGDTCLETPEGVKLGRGTGNSLVIRGGPPMLLMAVGRAPRQGFALILHDSRLPPTTLTNAWQPQGLCERQFATDQGK